MENMSFLLIRVYGNPSFGGYLSMDGGQSVQLVDDVVYEIEPGLHLFEVHSTSDSARRTGSITSAVNSFVGTDGVSCRCPIDRAQNTVCSNKAVHG